MTKIIKQMKINKSKNENYSAIVVEIKTLITLEKCDNVQGAIIMGNQVIVSKDVKIGDTGLYFPLECALSKEYLSNNNLYNKSELNADNTKKGYFDENGRVRCQRFRGHKSEGLFMPLESLQCFGVLELEINTCFDEINGFPICSKYIVKQNRTPGQPGSRKSKTKIKYESKLIENQFRFHDDTAMLYRNLHRITPESLIHISYKMHGTSGISSYILCKKKLNWIEKLLSKLNVNIKTEIYDYIYSSRKVIKNEELNPNAQHYYSEDIWSIAHKELEPFLQKGMTFYYEIVGYLPNGGAIQKDYDYGCVNPLELWERDFIIKNEGEKEYLNYYLKGRDDKKSVAIYIYRITSTNVDGKVIEFSAKQVQDFCKKNGLNAVSELYYGYAKYFTGIMPIKQEGNNIYLEDLESWRNHFLFAIKTNYNEKDCFMCKNQVPEEGCVIRIDGLEFEAYKQKSERFYARETVLLDKGESNIEDEN